MRLIDSRVAPNSLQQRPVSQYAISITCKINQKVELLRRQVHFLVPHYHLVALEINANVPNSINRSCTSFAVIRFRGSIFTPRGK